MLSVILYGRNDNHGYNLHKRAAISLNAIAHLLSDPADEIVFVDYNTPDDLPSFPEAIADTLTPKAIEKLRVLRVRPAVHQARYAARTHLNALEPIARNVAIRRANPQNRWVLSTNTDMIFVPRIEGQDLTQAIGGLADGFYHLPRFELPEGLWETLDRRDAAGMIESAREWGERFHLNEIVQSAGDNLYDGPGDFQLFLREDLFAIGGFHEEMIKGWHLDANVAKRMAMLRGRVSSALDRLIGYHCDHTRQATAYHKGDRIENSPLIFLDNVHEPQIRAQLADWGLPDEPIEELKLGRASGARYLKALNAVPPTRGEADDVLPYLLDLVANLPPGAKIGYAGDQVLAARFCTAWQAMGGDAPHAPDALAWLADTGPQLAPLADWASQSDLFIVDATAGGDRAGLVAEAMSAAAAADRSRRQKGAAARTVLVIGDADAAEDRMAGTVAFSAAPVAPHIRRGQFVGDLTAPAIAPLAVEGGRAFNLDDIAVLSSPGGAQAGTRFGAIFDRLEPLNGAARSPMALRLGAGQDGLLAGRADLGALSPGGYELAVEAQVHALAAAGEVLAIGVVGGGRLIAEHLQAAAAPGVVRAMLSFDVAPDMGDAAGGLTVGFKGVGGAEVDVSDLVLR
jgi:hypothetical protein